VQIKKINFTEQKTMQNQTLDRVATKEIGKREAYRLLYPKAAKVRGPKKAHFAVLRIRVPEEKAVNALLAFLFFLPVPLVFAKLILKRANLGEETTPLDKEDILKLISVRGLKVDVRTHDGVRVFIKTI